MLCYQLSPDDLEVPAKKAEVIVKKYVKPEKVGSLYLPSQSLEDRTGTVWEVVKSNKKADTWCGVLTPGDILKTRWGAGVTDLWTEDPADGRKMYLVRVEDIFHRIKNTWSTSKEE